MIDKEQFLHLVQNHHHKGNYTDDHGNYCLMGAAAKATNNWHEVMGCPMDNNDDFYKLKKALEYHIILDTEYFSVPSFNDNSSHEDVMLVAKKTVAEWESINV